MMRHEIRSMLASEREQAARAVTFATGAALGAVAGLLLGLSMHAAVAAGSAQAPDAHRQSTGQAKQMAASGRAARPASRPEAVPASRSVSPDGAAGPTTSQAMRGWDRAAPEDADDATARPTLPACGAQWRAGSVC